MEEKNCTITFVVKNRLKELDVARCIVNILRIPKEEAFEMLSNMPFTFKEKFTYSFAKRFEEQLTNVGADVKLEVDEPTYNPLTYDAPIIYSDTSDLGSLRNYLKDVYKLESTLYSYRCMKDKYNKQIQSLLFVPSVYDEMHKEKKVYRNEWHQSADYKEELAKYKSELNKRRSITILLCLITYVAILGYTCALEEGRDFAIVLSLILGIPAVAIVYAIGNKITQAQKYSTYICNLTEVKEKHISGVYQTGNWSYEKWRNAQLRAEAEARKPLANHLKQQLNDEILPQEEQTQKLLAHVYSTNTIHPKYRNFVAIAQILEYLDTGRCTELGGPNGAYNLYEQELRQNIIIDKLDQIINQLDRLNRTMGYVASAITQSNRLLGDISSSLGRIEANTALTAYNTQCIANNTSIANRYNYR